MKTLSINEYENVSIFKSKNKMVFGGCFVVRNVDHQRFNKVHFIEFNLSRKCITVDQNRYFLA
jgi:hypothetical protein